MLAWHLGWRWLRKRRAAWLALASITCTVAVSIVVVGVVQGLLEMTRRQVRANESDLTVTMPWRNVTDTPAARERLLRVPGVSSAAPFVSGFALLQDTGRSEFAAANRRGYGSRSLPARLDGIDWAAELGSGRLDIAALHPQPALDLNSADIPVDERGSGFLTPAWRDHLALSGLDLGAALGVGLLPPPPRMRPIMGVVCGRELLFQHGLELGAEVVLVGPDADGGAPPRERAIISDTLGTGLQEVDKLLVMAPLPQARNLLGFTGSGVEGWRLTTTAAADLQTTATAVNDATGLRVRTWQQERSGLIRALDQQRRIMAVVMSLIQVIAVFIVYAVFSTLVVEKRRDLGVLRGLGARPIQLAGAFIGAGLASCLIGGCLGWALGWLALALINPVGEWLGVPLFPQDIFYTAQAPISYNLWIPLGFIAFQTVVGLLAVALPAWRAARVDPIAVLRDDG